MSTLPGRTIVKVCGLTRREDAAHALACGADWLGFIVLGESVRSIPAEAAGAIVESLDAAVAVAVMVAPTPEAALAIASRMGASRIQLHQVDPIQWPSDFPLPCAFALGVDPTGSMLGMAPPLPHLVLLDTAHERLAGGTGRTFPWHAAVALAATREVMLAGGLGADNVAAAIQAVRPFGVDASSRLESGPGVKDAELVRRYVAAVRECDERRDAATR
ncbi:MAG: phosphoribosylanthranilate isomerase [Candidatus Eisenbacteria bacterium]